MTKEADNNPFKKHSISSALKADNAKAPEQNTESPVLTDDTKKRKPVKKDAPVSDKHPVSPKKDDDWSVHHITEDHSVYAESVNEDIFSHLMKLGLLDESQIAKVRSMMAKSGMDIVGSILKNKFLKEKEIGQAIASFFNCTYINFRNFDISPEVLLVIPKNVCQKSCVAAFEMSEGVIKIAMVNPMDLHLIHLIEKKTGRIADVHYTTPGQILEALKSYPSEFQGRFEHLMAKASDNISHLETLESISDVFDSLVLMAYQRNASDVHIEPFEDDIRVRFRIDGVLHSITSLPNSFLETIINHIKVLSKLRIDTHNASQDGRFHINYDQTSINFRVSIMPTHYGEKAVLRLLTSATQEWSLAELGYREHDRSVIERIIGKTNGMILCCGPTGSGKTTTLYAILKELNQEGVNISTIEDPIEYGLPGILQTQVNPNTNITYAEGLKSLMRQDPDILMIGEIRDFETGKIAVNSALTGHLVLSTLHTNNASLAPLRMLQMSVDPYLIVNTVSLIIAQRLVRKICDNCKYSYVMTENDIIESMKKFGLDISQTGIFDKIFSLTKSSSLRLFKGRGCDKCANTGFRGRSVISETLEMDDEIRSLIIKNAGESEIENQARKNGMSVMLEDGLMKVREGITTLEEVFRVINQ